MSAADQDAWLLCDDLLSAFDRLLCGRYVRHCSDCQRPAKTQTVWPVAIGGRQVGVLIGLCDACLHDGESPARVTATLAARYRAGGGVVSNADPFQGRIAKRRKGKPGNLLALQKLLWKALLTAEALLDGAADSDADGRDGLQLRAVHAISQASATYAKLLEVGELEARIVALEAQQKGTV